MTADPIAEFKAKQRASWAHFAPLEAVTTPTAAALVKFARVQAGQKVLDVGCGTGVAALTARRAGAHVTGLDLTPELLARAKENGSAPGFEDVVWKEGDAENLPFRDGEFDVVLSQFGHMFAPRPEVATREMLRVLRPGGTIAFSTWPPDLGIGRMFGVTGKYLPGPPGTAPPGSWGLPEVVRERLGPAVREVTFAQGMMWFPALSIAHHRATMEQTSGPVLRILATLQGDPVKLAGFRREIEAALGPYFEDNRVGHAFLMTRATKA